MVQKTYKYISNKANTNNWDNLKTKLSSWSISILTYKVLESCHSRSKIRRKKTTTKKTLNVKSATLLTWTKELRSQGQPLLQTPETQVNTQNHNLPGEEATHRHSKTVIDEFLEDQCKFAW